ncbi:TorF family putative porin [Vitreimonas sp.]|uniref:TorF family putative porin n=1 Tax=Vitreimonas sp. TaxID=3069702 RepID=UPI002ED8356B
MKKLLGLAMLAGAATVGTTGVAAAEGTVTANVAFTSNYVWRGITQSDGEFAVQGGADYSNDMFYVGTWASSVDDFGADASAELDVYAGFTPTLGPVSLDFGVLGYLYPGADDLDFFELKVAAGISPTDAFSIGAAAYASDEFGGDGGDESLYLELNAAYAFSDAFSVSGAFGNQDVDTAGDYDTWNIGASYAFHGFGFDLRYHEADIPGLDEEISFTISREL